MRAALIALALALGAQALTPTVGIKETARITIAGPGIAQTIEVIEPKVLALSGVYAGTFIGEPAAAPPDATWPRYTITFDIQTGGGVRRAAYGVDFARNRWTGEGFIYLPGRGEDGYRRNIGTMIRGQQDGKWHHATDAWSHALMAYLP